MTPDKTPWARTAKRARQALPLLVAARRRNGDSGEAAELPSPGPVIRPRPLDDVIGDCAVYEHGRRRPGRLPLEKAGSVARETPRLRLDRAAAADRRGGHRRGRREFALPPSRVEDAVKAHQRPKLEVYDDVLFVVLKPVKLRRPRRGRRRHRARDLPRPQLRGHRAARRSPTCCAGSGRSSTPATRSCSSTAPPACSTAPPTWWSTATRRPSSSSTRTSTRSRPRCSAARTTEDHAERIYKLKREIAEFRRAVLPLATPLQRLAEGAVPGIDTAAAPYFRDVHDHVLRAADAIEGHDRLLSDVLQADLPGSPRGRAIAVRQSEIAVRQNEDMRKISAWAAIALRAHRHRRHLRHELRQHARAALASTATSSCSASSRRLLRAVPAVPPQRLAVRPPVTGQSRKAGLPNVTDG